MDKKQLTALITQAYKSLTPKKVSVFVKNEDLICVRVVSEIFSEMTFSKRFAKLSELLRQEQPSLYEHYLFVFEAFTGTELQSVGDHDIGDPSDVSDNYKESAKEIEP